MKLVCTLVLSTAYLLLAPVLMVETARSLHSTAIQSDNGSTHYKTRFTHWHLDADADNG